jgi:hypothetical protein
MVVLKLRTTITVNFKETKREGSKRNGENDTGCVACIGVQPTRDYTVWVKAQLEWGDYLPGCSEKMTCMDYQLIHRHVCYFCGYANRCYLWWLVRHGEAKLACLNRAPLPFFGFLRLVRLRIKVRSFIPLGVGIIASGIRMRGTWSDWRVMA